MLNQSQRLLSAHTNPLTLLGGGGFDHPPTFELANQNAPFSLDQEIEEIGS